MLICYPDDSLVSSDAAWMHATPRQAHSFLKITAILPLPLIQEEQLSVNGKRMYA